MQQPIIPSIGLQILIDIVNFSNDIDTVYIIGEIVLKLIVRPMELEEVSIRIDYFLNASPEYLEKLGVNRSLLPARDAWTETYRRDFALPINQRLGFQLLWLGDDQPVGFSSVDRISFGQQANMHLHVLKLDQRKSGIGTECVRQSASIYFKLLELQRLFCQPNAFNTAPNRTLQKAGFKYVKTYETTPSSINFHQPVNQWVMERRQSYR
ncbi:MAG: GNAT family protein [Parasphingorhabdus sp.]